MAEDSSNAGGSTNPSGSPVQTPLSPSGTPIYRLPGTPVRQTGAVPPPPTPTAPATPTPSGVIAFERLPATPGPRLPILSTTVRTSAITTSAVTLQDMQKAVQGREQRRGVGLFRRLSLLPSTDDATIEKLSARMANQRTEFTPDLEASLFGLRRSAHPSMPGYDELGAFPMLKDADRYEFFVEDAEADSVVAYVRIPRRVVRRANEVRYTVNALPAEPVLPDVGARLKAAVAKPLFCPFRYDRRIGAVVAVSMPAQVTDRYADLSRLEIPLTVTDYEQRTAGVARVTMRGHEAYHKVIAEAHSWRLVFGATVVDLITDMFDTGVSQRDILTVSEYLQHVWTDRL